jgi:serine/threonine protein kinase
MRDTVGPYKLLERMGDDALGEIWRARDTARGRTASVRLVRPAIAADVRGRASLLADARAAASVSHPSIAALFEVVEDGDDLAFAHEHVEGRTLAATLGGSAINPRTAVAIGIQLADGLAELHAHGIVHGAIDGSQVIITPRGQAKLLDAGLSRWMAGAAGGQKDDLGALGALVGSMVGGELPPEPWADRLQLALARTRVDHPGRYEAVAAFAAELRNIAAALEARAVALPSAPQARGTSVVFWAVLALVLLLLGWWFLTR